MKISFYGVLCTFTINIGVISSLSWEGKILGSTALRTQIFHGVVPVRSPFYGRICVASAISSILFMSSGGCIREYKNQPNYGNINLRIGLRSVHISFMKTHPNYIPSRQHEFDIGIMRIRQPVNSADIIPFDVFTCINVGKPLTLYAYTGLQGRQCEVNVNSVGVLINDENENRRDKPFYITPVNETIEILQKTDRGSPVFKNNMIVGIVSEYFIPNKKNIVACTPLNLFEVWDFIQKELDEDKEKEEYSKKRNIIGQ